jgi:Flp pilus assembly protein TadD
MQRTELLVSCGALATVYAFVRSVAANQSPARRRGWMAVAVLTCAAAMAAKEVAVVIPLLVLLVDRTLHRESTLIGLLIRRRAFYAALAATWLILGALLALSPGRGASAGVASGMAWTDYALNQVAGIATYLGLSIWPTPLIFDRGDALLPLGAATVAGGGLLLSIVFGSVWAWRRWPLVAAMLLWFLLLLAPSSSVVPIATQILGEHRLYLALLGLVFLATATALRLLGPRRLVLASCALALPLLLLTVRRNRDFATLESIWADTARKAPTNARAHYNLGLALELAGKTDRAVSAHQTCVLLSPQHADAHAHLARLLQRTGHHREAIPHFEAAVRAKPDCALHNEAAVSLLISGDAPAAVGHFAASLQLSDAQPLVHYNLGLALQRSGKYAEALTHFESTIRLSPNDGDAQRAAARLREFLRQ